MLGIDINGDTHYSTLWEMRWIIIINSVYNSLYYPYNIVHWGG